MTFRHPIRDHVLGCTCAAALVIFNEHRRNSPCWAEKKENVAGKYVENECSMGGDTGNQQGAAPFGLMGRTHSDWTGNECFLGN